MHHEPRAVVVQDAQPSRYPREGMGRCVSGARSATAESARQIGAAATAAADAAADAAAGGGPSLLLSS